MEQTGRLYLCGTPIGNLGDITYRAVETLRAADCIAAEDTRHTRALLAHYDIHTPMTSYHEHNKDAKGPELIARLLAGETIVCVSDAGLPGIADPGG
ncbi:SAM-dependent methyltransferase, partial [Selenomonas noxia]